MYHIKISIFKNPIKSPFSFIPAFYAVIFKDLISAFATNSLWGALGWVICFAYSAELCTDVKTYICLGLLAVSAAGYYLVEYWVWQEKKEESENLVENEQIDGLPSYEVAVISTKSNHSNAYSDEVSSTAF